MSIENDDKIDGIGIDRGKGEVVLLISDHLPWDDQEYHFACLENKLSGYINFINTKQLTDMFSEANGLPVAIQLIYKFEPDNDAIKTLQTVARQLSEMGFSFSFRPLPAGY